MANLFERYAYHAGEHLAMGKSKFSFSSKGLNRAGSIYFMKKEDCMGMQHDG